MSEKVEVAAIEIEYPDGDVKKVSIEDARALFAQLKELFGEKTVVVPSTPVIIERDRWPRWDRTWYPMKVTYESTPYQTPAVWCCSE